MTIALVDAEMMAAEHPLTFSRPTAAELDAIRAGHIVKVCDNKERFWVVVTAVDGDKVTGIIDNDLVFARSYGLKTPITFHKRNIYSIFV